MMKYFILSFLFISSSFANETSQIRYQQVIQALKNSNENLLTESTLISFFSTQCDSKKNKVSFEEQETSERNNLLFHCNNDHFFLVRLNHIGHLLDFQYLKAPPPLWDRPTRKKESFPRDFKEALIIGTAVTAGILISSPIAENFYPKQRDKYLHVLAGDLISSSSTLFYYHGKHFNEDKSWALGFGTGVFAGILKEVYDKNWGPRKKAEQADAIATVIGSVVGSSLIRITLEY